MERTDHIGGRSIRPIRNRRYSRCIYDNYKKVFGNEKRLAKRLFTPEIKRFLKDWLIRRRDNPYPNREEKKILAFETGLTYIQICNWFANWRRKLKNSGNEPQRKTWGHLIKTYNVKAQGNVEQFSISSEDSIWGEIDSPSPNMGAISAAMDHCYTPLSSGKPNDCKLELAEPKKHLEVEPQCFQISSTTNEKQLNGSRNRQSSSKYKNNIMEKYLKGLQTSTNIGKAENKMTGCPPLLTKWLESAAKFKPKQKNYVAWKTENYVKLKNEKKDDINRKIHEKLQEVDMSKHQREELEAAEALTRLAGLFRRT